MDSGNSGSMQSSSTAGDEEYDSRADSSSISAFLTKNNNNNVNHVPLPPQQTTTTTLNHHVGPFTHVFDPLSNYLDPTQKITPNQILNLDMVWSKVAAARSEPPDLAGGLIPCSSSSPHNNSQAFLLSQLGTGQSQSQTQSGVNANTFSTTLRNLSESDGNGGSNSTNTNANTVRNPKKRSRASRRAPTTVLTTDTTNFRAMVQEFTGIPAPPFNSSPFPRTRLDLFASSVSSSSSSPPIMRSTSTHLDPPTTTPSYLPRPFPQKLQSQPSIPPMLDTLASHSSSTCNNFHNPLNLHNPILTLQSMLQPPQKYNNPSLLLASKSHHQQQQQPSLEIPHSGVDSSHIRMGGLEELGLSHAHVGGHHQNMVQSSSDLALSRVNNNNNNSNNLNNNSMNVSSSTNWGQAQAQAQRIGINDGGAALRSLSGGTLSYRSNVTDQRVSNGSKVNFSSGGASDFHGDKGPECAVVARSEGMVESWINCSSD